MRNGVISQPGCKGDDSAPSESLRGALLAAQAVAFDWSLTDGRVQWDAVTSDARQGADFNCADFCGPFRSLLDRESLRQFMLLMDEVFPSNPAFNLEFADGSGSDRRWFEMAALRIPGADGRAEKLKGVIRSTASGEQPNSRLAWLATRDDLTGHLNRSSFRQQLSRLIARASDNGETHAYLIAGIDQLGVINQVHGYDAADEVIAAIGASLARTLRSSDLIGRTAGNKFGIAVRLRNENELAGVVGRLQAAAKEKTIETRAGSVSATLSIGAVVVPKHAPTAEDAMLRAEEALERAKDFGRSGFVAFTPSVQRESSRRRLASIGDEIVSALEDRRVMFAFQPIIGAKSRVPELYECLLRIQRPDGTVLPAKDFIPAAEALGLVRLLDRRALELAVSELYVNKTLRLGVNVSGTTAGDRGWSTSVLEYIREHHRVAERLTVELTETAALHGFEESATFVTRLRDAGCRVAIDDFGAGHTSFRTLHQLRVDTVKIDGLYVENLSESIENQLFVRTLADLARSLKLETIAEWVSSDRDAALLESYGIDLFQGHHFGRPEIFPAWRQASVIAA